VLVAMLILRSAWKLTRESAHILLEGTPESLDPVTLRREIPEQLEAVCNVHHVHVWSLTPGRHLISLHAAIAEGEDRQAALVAIRSLLEERYGLDHATIQLESWHQCADEPDSDERHDKADTRAARPTCCSEAG